MAAANSLKLVLLLLGAFGLAGCDKFSGEVDQKNADAEAIGYACRISQKQPEPCMKENETFSPSLILDGWRAADKDIQDKVIIVGEVPLPAESAVAGDEPAEAENPAGDKNKTANKDEKPAAENKPADDKDTAQ